MDEPALDERLRAALAALPGEAPLPPDLEGKVGELLRARGLLSGAPGPGRWQRARGPRRFRWAIASASLLAVALGGYAAGSRAHYGASDSWPHFLLLLEEGEGYQAAVGAVARTERVEEYARWARRLAAQGSMLAGDELAVTGAVVDARGDAAPLPAGPEHITGYFLIRAAGDQQALELARRCPHLRHHGRIELRRLEPAPVR